MDYQFRFSLSQAPTATNDGSSTVNHDITAQAEPVGDGGYTTVPGRHKTICIPADELQTVLDMPDGTGSQKTAKNTAYKNALADNLNTTPVPATGWSDVELEALMDANDAATAAASEANDYITVTLSLSYPVPFSI